MLGIVGIAADFPEVGLQGLFATGSVFLCDEGSLVGRDVHQVGLACRNGCTDCGEAGTSIQFLGGRQGAAFYFAPDIDAVTVRVLGCCYAMRTKQHFCARVLSVLARFAERSRYRVDTRAPFYMCHNC